MIEWGLDADTSEGLNIFWPGSYVPDWIQSATGVFTMVMHGVKRYPTSAGFFRNFLTLDGKFIIRGADSSLVLRSYDTSGTIIANTTFTNANTIAPTGSWGTIAVVWDLVNKRASGFLVGDTDSIGIATDLSAYNFTSTTGQLNIGGDGSMTTDRPFYGLMNMVAFYRDLKVGLEEVEYIHRLKKTWAGGLLYSSGMLKSPNGLDGTTTNTYYAIHGFYPPADVSITGAGAAAGALIGDVCNVGSGLTTIRGENGGIANEAKFDDWWGLECYTANDTYPRFVDPHDHAESSGYWNIDTPTYAAAATGVAGNSVVFYRLVENSLPDYGCDRYLVWSNSRGMRQTDAYERTRPANHFHGYWENRKDKHRGVINVPLRDVEDRFFCFDHPLGIWTSGTNASINKSDTYADFRPLWTNGSDGSVLGGGEGFATTSNGAFFFAAHDEEDTLFNSGYTRSVEYVILGYPNAPSLRITPAIGVTSNGNPEDVYPTDKIASSGATPTLDTSVFTYAMQAGDGYNAAQNKLNLQISSVQANQIQSGWGIFCYDGGSADGALFEVSGVTASGGSAYSIDVYFDSAKGTPTSASVSKLSFGPLEYNTYNVTFNAGVTGWLGAIVQNTDTNVLHGPLISFCANAYANNVSGFIGGAAGNGGNGYALQISESIPEMVSNIINTLNVSDIGLHYATQSSTTADMGAFADLVNAASGYPIYLADQQHGVDETTSNTYGTFILGQSTYPGVATSFTDPLIGSAEEQWVRGFKTDEAHPNAYGMTRIALLNLQYLEGYLTDVSSCSGIDDDVVNVLRINRFASRLVPGTYNVLGTQARMGSNASNNRGYFSAIMRPVENLNIFTQPKTSDRDLIHGELIIPSGRYLDMSSSGVDFQMITGSGDTAAEQDHKYAFKEGVKMHRNTLDRGY